MRLIPVLDIRHGRAVHAKAGDRDHYEPVRSQLHEGSDPIDLARSFREVLGLEDLYLADLGAILDHDRPATALYRQLAGLGLNLWVDAGIRTAADIAPLIEAGVERLVVGLETVEGPASLAEVVREAGSGRVVFSLDLRDGRPLVDTQAAWGTDDPARLAELAIEAGVGGLLELDLARVGTGRGVAPMATVASRAVERFIGGGIAGGGQLVELAGLGYSGVLVGSALHDGRIGRAAIQDFRSRISDFKSD